MRKLRARLQKIQPVFFQVAEVDDRKVDALVEHVRNGGRVPPVVVVSYGADGYMPIDGHHRMSAAGRLGMDIDAWVVSGSSFEDLDCRCQDEGEGRAEDHIDCGGVPALQVAP